MTLQGWLGIKDQMSIYPVYSWFVKRISLFSLGWIHCSFQSPVHVIWNGKIQVGLLVVVYVLSPWVMLKFFDTQNKETELDL